MHKLLLVKNIVVGAELLAFPIFVRIRYKSWLRVHIGTVLTGIGQIEWVAEILTKMTEVRMEV